MAQSDPIADMLTRIKNALMRRKHKVQFPASKIKLEIVKILKDHSFIVGYEITEENKKQYIEIELNYSGKLPMLSGVKRISTPGKREYVNEAHLKTYKKANHITIISTSSGVMTLKEALDRKIGGELVCTLW